MHSLCITAWTGSAALLSLGLSPWQTIGVGFLAKVIMISLALGVGWLGAEWHVGFTVSLRSVLGMYGSFVGISMRVILSVVWYASQAWLGGLCVTAMLSSWSYKFLTMENTLPKSAHMVTRDFTGFVIFQFISIPFMVCAFPVVLCLIVLIGSEMIRPEKVKFPIAFANLFTTCVMVGITIKTCKQAGGVGPLLSQGTTYSTLSPTWAWLYAITSSIGGISSGILNQSDFTRLAIKQGKQVPGTIAGFFIVGTIVPIMSILTASASIRIYGDNESVVTPVWNPLTLIIQWSNYPPSPPSTQVLTDR